LALILDPLSHLLLFVDNLGLLVNDGFNRLYFTRFLVQVDHGALDLLRLLFEDWFEVLKLDFHAVYDHIGFFQLLYPHQVSASLLFDLLGLPNDYVLEIAELLGEPGGCDVDLSPEVTLVILSHLDNGLVQVHKYLCHTGAQVELASVMQEVLLAKRLFVNVKRFIMNFLALIQQAAGAFR
jgi:hypothetical protein